MSRSYRQIPWLTVVASALLAFATTPSLAQSVGASALDVWLACRSPESLDSAEISSVFHDALRQAPIRANARLRYLCHEMVVPQDLRSWRAVSAAWDSALDGTKPIPTSREIRRIAGESLRKLQEWEVAKANAAADARWARLRNVAVYFAPGQTEVPAADSLSVRELAEAVRDYQAIYPAKHLTIRGMTDPTGSDTANARIATARATNLKIALVRQGGINDALIDITADVVNDSLIPTSVVATGRAARLAEDGEGAGSRRQVVDFDPGATSLEHHAVSGINPVLRTATVEADVSGAASPVLTRFTTSTPAMTAVPAAASAAPNWAVAVTDVVIERAKDDLTIYLVGEASEVICKPDRAEYFPATCALMASGASYQPTMDMLRVALSSDAGTVLSRSFRLPPAEATTLVNATATQLVPFGIKLAHGRSVGDLLPVTLESIADSLQGDTQARDLLRSAASLAHLYHAARSEITSTTVASARQEAVASSLRALVVSIADSTLRVGHPNFSKLSMQVMPLVSGLDNWDRAVEDVREMRGAPMDVQIRALSEALSTGITVLVTTIPTLGLPQASEDLARLRELAAPVQDLLSAYAAGDYRGAFFHGVRFYSLTHQPPPTEARFLAFAMNFASAKDEGTMRESLRQFVGQGGGFRQKRTGFARGEEQREKSFTTLNAYVGPAAGGEVSLKGPHNVSGQGAVMLALGVEHGWRRGSAEKPWFNSLFLQVVDLGAIAAARVSSSDAEVPSPRLSQVLSPGIFAVFGRGRAPLAFGLGVALAPEARRVNSSGDLESRTAPAVRFGFFFAGDVPLFP